MGIKKYTPYTPSRRHMTVSAFDEITKSTPEKSLVVHLKKSSGRNNQGKITVRHKGGGAAIKYRLVDFKRYILAPVGLHVGDHVMNGPEAEVKVGNTLPMSMIPVGANIHNIEMKPGKGGQLVRSAGNVAQLMAKEGKYATVKLPSGEMRLLPIECRATIGQVGNIDHELVHIGKAGRKRHMGIRPTVRGSVMNPNDHPHGGGEGRAPIGRPSPMTPWGKPAMGYKTRNKHKASNKYIIRRRNG